MTDFLDDSEGQVPTFSSPDEPTELVRESEVRVAQPIGYDLGETDDAQIQDADMELGGEPLHPELRTVSSNSGAQYPNPGTSKPETRKPDEAAVAKPPTSPLKIVREYATLAVVAILLASLVRAFLGQAYWIPSESMVPTLKVHDRVIVSRVNYHLGDPKRADIVVFQNPGFTDEGRKDPLSRSLRNVLELVGIGQPRDKYYIKRIIGTPGDHLQIKENHVFINGTQLIEPWLKPTVITADNGTYGGKELVLGKSEYFMMGDNRENSADSRVFGPIDRKTMIGKAFIRIFPFSRFGGL